LLFRVGSAEGLVAAGEGLEIDIDPGLKALALAVILLAVRDAELNNEYSVDAERFLNESIELKFWLRVAGIK